MKTTAQPLPSPALGVRVAAAHPSPPRGGAGGGASGGASGGGATVLLVFAGLCTTRSVFYTLKNLYNDPADTAVFPTDADPGGE